MTDRLTAYYETQQPHLPETGFIVSASPHRGHSAAQALRCALGGLCEVWRTQRNFRLQCYAALGVIALSAILRLSMTEWLWILFAVGLVLFAELMNTAIEQTVDLVVGLRFDPLARRIKDMAAGCVVVAATIAVVIGFFTFGPYLH